MMHLRGMCGCSTGAFLSEFLVAPMVGRVGALSTGVLEVAAVLSGALTGARPCAER